MKKNQPQPNPFKTGSGSAQNPFKTGSASNPFASKSNPYAPESALQEQIAKCKAEIDAIKGNLKIKDINIKDYNTKTVLKEDVSGKLFNLAALIMKTNKSTQDKVSIISQIDEVKKNGTAPEEFFGILWWRYKKYAANDKKNMSKLLDIYHDGHGGEEEMWIGLERWILK
jgi:hypothetical protein